MGHQKELKSWEEEMYNITMFLNAWCKRPIEEPYHYPWLIKVGVYLPFLMSKYLIMPEIVRAWKRQAEKEAKEVEKHKEIHKLIAVDDGK